MMKAQGRLYACDKAGKQRICVPLRSSVPQDGGQGEVLDDSMAPALKLKLFNSRTDFQAADRRLRMMLDVDIAHSSRSRISAKQIIHYSWPIEILYKEPNRTGTCGFSMRKIHPGEALSLVRFFHPRDLHDAGYRDSRRLRMTTAQNLAEKLALLHKFGICVPDLNIGNVFVYKGGDVALVDCDGYSFNRASQEFLAEAVAEDISSPERQASPGKTSWEDDLHQERFALGAQLFGLVNQNLHPYDGQRLDIDNDPTATGKLADRIKAGYYPYGVRPHAFFRPVSTGSLHSYFPPTLRNLFDRCFQQKPIDRPSAEEWLAELRKLNQRARDCPTHGAGAAWDGVGCPLCNVGNVGAQAPPFLTHPQWPPAVQWPPAAQQWPSAGTPTWHPLPASLSPLATLSTAKVTQRKPPSAPRPNKLGVLVFAGIVGLGAIYLYYFNRPSVKAPPAVIADPKPQPQAPAQAPEQLGATPDDSFELDASGIADFQRWLASLDLPLGDTYGIVGLRTQEAIVAVEIALGQNETTALTRKLVATLRSRRPPKQGLGAAYLELASRALEENDVANSIRLLKQSQQFSPDAAKLISLGQLAKSQGDNDSARRWWSAARELSAGTPTARQAQSLINSLPPAGDSQQEAESGVNAEGLQPLSSPTPALVRPVRQHQPPRSSRDAWIRDWSQPR
jgi:hypothetical protein